MSIKPILLIIFNRPDTTARVFDVIRSLKPSRLYVAADGPREGRDGEADLCAETRRLATAIDWPCELKIRFLEKNAGCHVAVPAAISWFFEYEEDGIILEDDCLASADFFNLCEDLLERYREDRDVMMISGDNFQTPAFKTVDGASYYFSGIANIWGWATWRRAWSAFKDDFKELDDRRMKKEIERAFSSRSSRRYWYGFYKKIKKGRLENWDAKWLLSIVYGGGVAAVPSVNLVQNIGFGSAATHSAGDFHMSVEASDLKNIIHPKSHIINHEADDWLIRSIYFRSLGERAMLKIRSYLK